MMVVDDINIATEILSLPVRMPCGPVSGDANGLLTREGLLARLRGLRGQLMARERSGDRIAAALLALGERWPDAIMAELAGRIALEAGSANPDEPPHGLLWSLAETAYQEVRLDLAAMAFGLLRLLAEEQGAGPEPSALPPPKAGDSAQDLSGQDVSGLAMCGLAMCALAGNRLDEADAFALASLDSGGAKARAYCIAGYCALARGNRRSAQTLLATAARIGRRNPLDREDMRLAQRLLLTLHFG